MPLPGSHSLKFLALTAAFAALALPSASAMNRKAAATASIRACAHSRTGKLRLAPKPRKCHRGERIVLWGVQGPRGIQGLQGSKGDTGAAGPAGPGRPAMFSAQATAYVGALSPAFAAVTGITQVTSTESQAQTLGPAADFTAGSMSVRVSAAPGTGNSVTVTLRDDGADTSVACTISDAATTCASSTSALVASGSAIALKISSTPATPAMSLLVGLQGN